MKRLLILSLIAVGALFLVSHESADATTYLVVEQQSLGGAQCGQNGDWSQCVTNQGPCYWDADDSAAFYATDTPCFYADAEDHAWIFGACSQGPRDGSITITWLPSRLSYKKSFTVSGGCLRFCVHAIAYDRDNPYLQTIPFQGGLGLKQGRAIPSRAYLTYTGNIDPFWEVNVGYTSPPGVPCEMSLPDDPWDCAGDKMSIRGRMCWARHQGPSETPLPTNTDEDGDGYTGDTEAWVGTTDLDRCGDPQPLRAGYTYQQSGSWPSDLNMGGFSLNKIDVLDISSFIAPVRVLDTSLGDPYYDIRWDLQPGKGVFNKEINVTDLTTLQTNVPPMFGVAAYNSGLTCTD